LRTRQRRIKFQRFCDGRLCLRHRLPRRSASLVGVSEPKVGHRQLCVRRRISRVLLDSCLEVHYRCLGTQFGQLASEIQSAQVIVLCLRVDGATDRKASPLLRRQLDLDFVGDGACNLALQTQNIANAAIVFTECTTVPSSTASTFSSPAISRSDFLLPLY